MNYLLLLAALGLGNLANATGGFSCEFADSEIKFELGGVTTRSFENDIVSLDAELSGTISHDGKMDVRHEFTKADARQYWNNGQEFRILLYAENEAANKNTRVTIKTRAMQEGVEFKGTISIDQSSPASAWSIEEKEITCELE